MRATDLLHPEPTTVHADTLGLSPGLAATRSFAVMLVVSPVPGTRSDAVLGTATAAPLASDYDDDEDEDYFYDDDDDDQDDDDDDFDDDEEEVEAEEDEEDDEI